MPRYEYECPLGHVTEKVVGIRDDAPATVRCPKWILSYPDAEPERRCGRRAKKRTVYRVGVTGDLPTRGAF